MRSLFDDGIPAGHFWDNSRVAAQMRMALQPTKFPQMRMEPLGLTIKLL